MKKIRILHVAQAAGGVDRYLQALLKYIDRDKYENILVCSQDYNEANYAGIVDFFEQVKMVREISFKDDLSATIEIRKMIKKYKPDIVYAHSSKAGVLGRFANIGFKNKCIYNPHGWSFNMDCSEKKKNLYITIERISSIFCDQIVCISNAEYHSALQHKICKADKLQVIFNGIDIDQYRQNRIRRLTKQDIGIPDDSFVIGMVGRVSEQKAPDIFAKAAKLIKKVIPNSYFIIVGNGNLEDEIKKYVIENGLNNSFKITGWVENPMDYIQLFDEAMLLSRWEGFGLVLPEYMIARKPIIATNIDAIPDLINDGNNGLLVPVNDPEEVSKKALLLYQDKGLYNKLANNGEDIVYKKFDAKRVANEHEILFESLSGIREYKEKSIL